MYAYGIRFFSLTDTIISYSGPPLLSRPALLARLLLICSSTHLLVCSSARLLVCSPARQTRSPAHLLPSPPPTAVAVPADSAFTHVHALWSILLESEELNLFFAGTIIENLLLPPASCLLPPVSCIESCIPLLLHWLPLSSSRSSHDLTTNDDSPSSFRQRHPRHREYNQCWGEASNTIM